MHRFFCTLFVVCQISLAWSTLEAQVLNQWHPQALRSIPYNPIQVGDRFIAAGRNGHILHSTNGLAWDEQILSETNQIFSVTHGGGIFVAVGTDGSVWSSSDSLNWTRQITGITNHLHAVTYGNGEFVAVASSAPLISQSISSPAESAILVSSNGMEWAIATNRVADDLRNIVFYRDRFISFGGKSDFSSSNGRDWSSVTTGPSAYSLALEGADKVFVFRAVEFPRFISSTNGIDWSMPYFVNGDTYNLTINDLAFGRNLFLAAATKFQAYRPCAFCTVEYRLVGSLVTTADGNKWSTTEAPAKMGLPLSVYYAGEQFVIVDENRSVWISENGVQWKLWESSVEHNYASIAYGNGKYVAIGTESIAGTAVRPLVANSPDGVRWEQVAPENIGFSAPSKVVFGGQQFLAFHHLQPSTNDTFQFPQKISVSTNGKAWGVHSLATNWIYLDVTADNGRYLALAIPSSSTNAYILSSTNAIEWVQQSGAIKDTRQTSRLFVQNGVFFVGGQPGIFQSSNDGTNWFGLKITASERVAGVSYGDGKYVAVGGLAPGATGQFGNASFALVSTNGLVWKPYTEFKSRTLNDVTFFNGDFIAVGEPPLPLGNPLIGPPGALYISNNAINWNMRGPGDVRLVSLTSDGRSVVAVGENGAIWKSRTIQASNSIDIRLSVMRLQTNNMFRLNVTSSHSGSAVLEEAANLKDWEAVKNLVLQAGSQVEDISVGNSAQRFYRVRMTPE